MNEKIIQFLKQANGYTSGEDMSDLLGISRAAVWKYIDQLRQEGYEITAVPHLGYKLEAVPDRLLPQEIIAGLQTRILGRRIEFFDNVGSTMDTAFRLGMEGAPEGTMVCAETQAKGRGRLGRRWVSPKGKGIYFSLILRPKSAPAQLAQLTLMSAVALSQALETCEGLRTQIKWPNDIVCGKRKLAGILTELRAEIDQVKFVVLGIGINVNTTASHLLPSATSIKVETGKHFNRVALLQRILTCLEFWYDRIDKEGFEVMIEEWKKRSGTLNQRVRVTDLGGTIEGMAFDLDHDGGLLVRQDSGQVVKKLTGDVVQLR